MKISVVFAATFFTTSFVYAQANDVHIHSSTNTGNQGRYEVIQSTLAARWTFRLDKVCGNVGQIVTTKTDGVIWESMLIVGLPQCKADGKTRYQLFTSGLAARHTFLLNIENGKTWQIKTMKDNQGAESTAWFPFDE
jgi:hypothetical protein